MIRRLEQSAGNILGFSIAGEITDEEYTRMVSELRDAIAMHDSIRLLLRVKDISPKSVFSGFEERYDFITKHADDVERIALVTDSIAGDLFSLTSGMLSDIEVESFDREEEDKAWAWLK